MTLIAWSTAARGQDAATRGIIQWRDGAIATPQQDAAAQSQAVESVLRSGARHVVVQFDRPLTPGQRQELASAGVTLLSYLGDNAFFAGVGADCRDAGRLSRIDGLRCVLPIQRNWKLHPALGAGRIPEWAIVEREGTRVQGFEGSRVRGFEGSRVRGGADGGVVVAVYVVFHPDVPLTDDAGLGGPALPDARHGGLALQDAVGTCRRHGAWVRSLLRTVNGLVIELPADRIAALADEDAVQWIEPPLPRLSEQNDDSRERVGTDIVHEPPYGLSGVGVTVLVYDTSPN